MTEGEEIDGRGGRRRRRGRRHGRGVRPPGNGRSARSRPPADGGDDQGEAARRAFDGEDARRGAAQEAARRGLEGKPRAHRHRGELR
jgi:hypothetical protein